MAITKEYLDSISFDIAKQKYYNANKVDAVLRELKAGVAELLEENEKLRSGNGGGTSEAADATQQALSIVGDAKLEAEKILAAAKQEASDIIGSAKAKAAAEAQANGMVAVDDARQQALSIVGSAKLEAEKILVGARQEASDIIDKAKAKAAAEAQANSVSAGFSARQLDAIDKINKQLDELNVTQATQIFRLKQALVTMATSK